MAENRQQSLLNIKAVQTTTLKTNHISAATVLLTHVCFCWSLKVLLLDVCF